MFKYSNGALLYSEHMLTVYKALSATSSMFVASSSLYHVSMYRVAKTSIRPRANVIQTNWFTHVVLCKYSHLLSVWGEDPASWGQFFRVTRNKGKGLVAG